MQTDQQRWESKSILANIIAFLCLCYMLVLLCLFFFGCMVYACVCVGMWQLRFSLSEDGNLLFTVSACWPIVLFCVQGNCFFFCMWVSTAFLCVDVLQGMDDNCFLFCVWMQKLVRGLEHVTRIQCSWTFIFIKYNMWKPSLQPHRSPCTSCCVTFTRANMAALPVIYEDYIS